MCLLHQLDSVAECASRLRLLNKALDVSVLRLDSSAAPWRQELVRLQGAGLGLDIKESLLEACGLVLLANNQLDPHKSGELIRGGNYSCRSNFQLNFPSVKGSGCERLSMYIYIHQECWRGWCPAWSSSSVT